MSFPTPEAAEAAFYAAFEARSLDAMMAVWASDDSIACIHPLAAPLNGHAAWRGLAQHVRGAGQFVCRSRSHMKSARPNRSSHLREYLVIGQETGPRPPILATNVYRKEAVGWRMVLHHASPLQVGGTPPHAPRLSCCTKAGRDGALC